MCGSEKGKKRETKIGKNCHPEMTSPLSINTMRRLALIFLLLGGAMASWKPDLAFRERILKLQRTDKKVAEAAVNTYPIIKDKFVHELTLEEAQMMVRYLTNAPAATPGDEDTCVKICLSYARKTVAVGSNTKYEREIGVPECLEDNVMHLAKNGSLVDTFPLDNKAASEQSFPSYRPGDVLQGEKYADLWDLQKYLGKQAKECAKRGAKCDKRYGEHRPKEGQPWANNGYARMPLDASFDNAYCKRAAQECNRVKRQVALCVQNTYDECVAVCTFKGCSTEKEVHNWIGETPRGGGNFIDGIGGVHSQFEGPTSSGLWMIKNIAENQGWEQEDGIDDEWYDDFKNWQKVQECRAWGMENEDDFDPDMCNY